MSTESDTLITEFQVAQDTANHFNLIGWLITSFFLIFLGTMLSTFLGWTNDIGGTNQPFRLIIISLTILFGVIVTILFLKSQNMKIKAYNKALGALGKLRKKEYLPARPKEVNLFLYIFFMILIGVSLVWLFIINLV